MIAPPGMGKTTLLYRFLSDMRETTRTVFLFDIDAQCKPRDFIAYILRDIGITPGQSSSEMHKQLSAALDRENRAGRKFVVVIDEAQNLSDAVLERVRLLSNYETSQGKLMHIVLSGQPQLANKLIQPSQVQLLQRITTICRIEPLSAEETVGYIDYRLKLPGYDGEPLFTKGALNLITEASHGTPRTINNLCYDALSACYALKSKQVDGSMVAKVIADLQLAPQSREPIAAAVNVAAERPIERKQLKRAKQLLRRLSSSNRRQRDALGFGSRGAAGHVRAGRTPAHRSPGPSDGRRPLSESEGSAGVSPCASRDRHWRNRRHSTPSEHDASRTAIRGGPSCFRAGFGGCRDAAAGERGGTATFLGCGRERGDHAAESCSCRAKWFTSGRANECGGAGADRARGQRARDCAGRRGAECASGPARGASADGADCRARSP